MPPVELEHELALLLLPDGDAKRRHAAALADQLDIETWEANALLESRLPRILMSTTADRLEPIRRALEQHGVPIATLETGLLLADLDEWVVERLEYDDTGHLQLVGAEGSVTFRVGEPSLLVRGWEMRRGDQGGTLERVQFAHLYEPDNPRPFCLIESEIRSYAFLEDDVQPSARRNFETMLQLLASAPRMRVEEGLLDETSAQGALKGLRRRGTDSATSSSAGATLALIPEHVISRIHYYVTLQLGR